MLVIVNNTVINVSLYFLSRYLPRSEIAEYDSPIFFKCLNHFCIILHSSCICLHSLQWGTGILISPYSRQCLILFTYLISFFPFFSFFNKKWFIILCVGVFGMNVYVCVPCECLAPMEARRSIRFPWTGVMDSCEPLLWNHTERHRYGIPKCHCIRYFSVPLTKYLDEAV